AREREREARDAGTRVQEEQRNATTAAADAKSFGDFLVDNFLAATRPEGMQGGIGYDIKISVALARAEADIPAVFAGRAMGEARDRGKVEIFGIIRPSRVQPESGARTPRNCCRGGCRRYPQDG